MRVIIAGSRSISSYDTVKKAIEDSGLEISEVVSGGAKGVDTLGELWAHEHNIPVVQFIPQWDIFGKSAGFKHNTEMVDYAKAGVNTCLGGMIAVWDGLSRGTADTIRKARDAGLIVQVFITTK